MISIIVPVYNSKRYLPRCIESICGQIYRELEIILVDDGSMDGSGELCEAYAKKDPRILVLRSTRMRGSFFAYASHSSPLPSMEPSSTRIISSSRYICPQMLSMHRGRYLLLL